MKQLITTLIIVALIAVGAYFLIQYTFNTTTPSAPTPEEQQPDDITNGMAQPLGNEQPKETAELKATSTTVEKNTIIGTSVNGHDITAYQYGTGDTELLFVAGIHGGYEWNSVLLAYALMDYLKSNPDVIPTNEQVTVIPVLNPDGLYTTVGTAGTFTASDVPASIDKQIAGRFNGNNVDLNRNFDCDWQASGTWQNKTVSGGSAPFSEPESKAFMDYVDAHSPTAVVVYYSAVGGVFASNCHNGILPETSTLTNLYANASGYKAYENFNFYKVTGDAVNWLAKNSIPAISVLLTNHQDIEWTKNKAGVDAVLSHYGK